MRAELFEQTPPFDLEILLPVHPRGHWLERLERFRRFGLLGGHGHRIRLVLLPGSCELDCAFQNADAWEGIDEVVVVAGPYDHPAPKVSHHYAHTMPNEALCARWYLRLDDDSLTDLDRMIRYLDSTLDWRDPLHLSGTINCDILPAHSAILREVDGDRFLRDRALAPLYHEWEASITSAAAMQRILSHAPSLELLRRISLLPDGFSDHPLPLAARLCGILLSPIPVMSAHCQIEEFATFAADGQGLFHIHYLSPDNPTMWRRYMEKRRESGLPTDMEENPATVERPE